MRPKRPYEGFRVTHHQDVWTAAEEHGGRSSASRCSARERRSVRITVKLTADAARRNSSRRLAIRWHELEETAYWLELLVEGKIVAASKLELLRKETDELTAIFVTILKRSKES